MRESLPGFMKHLLRVLEDAGLIARSKEGRVVSCELSAKPMQAAAAWMSRYEKFWSDRLDSLARYLYAKEAASMASKGPAPSPNVARKADKVWKEHGALAFHECAADDVKPGRITSFPQSVKLKAGETVFFSWIVYRTRAHRDRVLKKVMADPRLKAMMRRGDMPFDAKRMIYGAHGRGVPVSTPSVIERALRRRSSCSLAAADALERNFLGTPAWKDPGS